MRALTVIVVLAICLSRTFAARQFFENFDDGLAVPSKWQGRYPTPLVHGGEVVFDPTRYGRALHFTRLWGGGDIITTNPVCSSGQSCYLYFDYMGDPDQGGVANDLGGFLWLGSGGNNPGTGTWVFGTSGVSGFPNNLIDDGIWHRYTLNFQYNYNVYLGLEDWDGSGGVPGDAYFDNILVTDANGDDAYCCPDAIASCDTIAAHCLAVSIQANDLAAACDSNEACVVSPAAAALVHGCQRLENYCYELIAGAGIQWVNWETDTGSVVSGTLSPHTGVPAGVDYTGPHFGSFLSYNPTIWTGSGFSTNGPATDNSEGIQVNTAIPVPAVISFSRPVRNPYLAFASLGGGGGAAPIVYFSADFRIVSSGSGFAGTGPFTRIAPFQLRGQEGNGIIRFDGLFTSISFTVDVPENWWVFTVGIGDCM